MKDPLKLQAKLRSSLKTNRDLNLNLPVLPMTNKELADVAWVVGAYLQSRDSVIESDESLRTWYEEYKFFLSEQKGG